MKHIIFSVILISFSISKMNAQVLETEESKPLLPGQFEIGTGFEYQVSKEGKESALPFAIEYGLTRKLTVLVEPVGFTSIRPKTGPHATGIGDLEGTLFFQLFSETKYLTSVSLSAEIKIPTTHNLLIGTGKTDFTPYLILSKTTGKFFTSINASYTFLGKPAGVSVSNLFNYAIGTIYHVTPKSIFFGELYGNTSAFGGEMPEGDIASNPNINLTELSGGETVIAAGYGYYAKKGLLFSIGTSYDNNKALLFRPGIEWKFGGKNRSTAGK